MWNIQLPFRKKLSIWALMAMGLVCTACSAVRAKSLDAKAKDLACKSPFHGTIGRFANHVLQPDEYGIVAIWAITELCLGIIATNLGLSRSIYYYFFKRSEMSTQRSSQRPTYGYGGRSRDGYAQHSDFPNSSHTGTSKIERRENSTARSEDSDIPLKPVSGIEKTTKIEMHVQ